MQLNHTFRVPTSVDEAWVVLRDIERIAPCMPGASIDEVEGDEFSGRVKVKVGPMQVTYKGTARFTNVDEEHHRATIEARGQEVRGSGTANATIAAELVERDGQTEVTVITDLNITGRPAQFGRGVMADVGEKLLGQFADCLAQRLGEQQPAAEAAAGVPPETPATVAPAEAAPAPEPTAAAEAPPAGGGERVSVRPLDQAGAWPEAEPIDLLGVASGPVLKRLAPVAAAVALLLLLVWLIRRRS